MDDKPMLAEIPPDPAVVEAKKYIRTFEADQQTVIHGGAPDLVPFVSPPVPPGGTPPVPDTPPAPPVVETPVAPAPTAPAPVAPEPSIMSQPVEPVAVKMPVAPEPKSPVTPELPKAPVEKKPSKLVGAIETYSYDFMERVKKSRASTATVLAAEQDAKKGAPELVAESKVLPMTVVYGVAGLVLCVAGAVGTYFAFTQYDSTHTPIALSPRIPAPIAVDAREIVSASGADLLTALSTAAAAPLDAGKVKLLYTASSTAIGSSTPVSVFSSLVTSAPNVLPRNVIAAGSMAGVVNVGGEQSVFFILAVTSYKDTFSGMLSWEPKMLTDLGALYPAFAATTTATTTASSTPPLPKAPVVVSTKVTFSDTTIANHDARIARDSAGHTLLVYGYWSPTTLVIARSAAAFTDVLKRLATAHGQ